MNTINDKFSFRRLWTVMKLDILADRIYIISWFLICLGFMSVWQFVELRDAVEVFHRSGNDYAVTSFGLDTFSRSMMVYVMVLVVVTAMISNPLKDKGKAINYLMVPATSLEKFVSRTFLSLFGVTILALVAWFLADVLRIIVVSVVPRYAELPAGFKEFTLTRTLNFISALFVQKVRPDVMLVTNYAIMAFYVFFHSLVLLGGCLFRGFFAALAPTIAFTFVMFKTEFLDVWERLVASTPVLTLVVTLALVVFNWWLSYRLFSRKQVVPMGHLRSLSKRKEVAV